jgi:hypothetical protein
VRGLAYTLLSSLTMLGAFHFVADAFPAPPPPSPAPASTWEKTSNAQSFSSLLPRT